MIHFMFHERGRLREERDSYQSVLYVMPEAQDLMLVSTVLYLLPHLLKHHTIQFKYC